MYVIVSKKWIIFGKGNGKGKESEGRERRFNSKKQGPKREPACRGQGSLAREREAVERQVPAGRDDEAVILDVEDANGVSLDEGGPDAGACEEVQDAELVGLRDEEAEVWETVKMRAERKGRVKGVARENSAVLAVMRTSFPADAGTWIESGCSAGASDAWAMVAQLSGSVSVSPVGRQ